MNRYLYPDFKRPPMREVHQGQIYRQNMSGHRFRTLQRQDANSWFIKGIDFAFISATLEDSYILGDCTLE